MAVVRVKGRFQVTLPASIRQKARVGVGDLLEAGVRGRKITLTPRGTGRKARKDRGLAEGLDDLRQGRVYGPFRSAGALVRSLHRQSRKLKQKTR
jgi:bifunctional DNA-binding transcriptional regulator/antitoxin component of YhaV-PrlF toxin-antitoxin module